MYYPIPFFFILGSLSALWITFKSMPACPILQHACHCVHVACKCVVCMYASAAISYTHLGCHSQCVCVCGVLLVSACVALQAATQYVCVRVCP